MADTIKMSLRNVSFDAVCRDIGGDTTGGVVAGAAA